MKSKILAGFYSLILLLGSSFFTSSFLTPTANAQNANGKTITQQELVQMLDNMGLEPKKTSDYWSSVAWHGEKLEFSISCGIKENGDYIYLESYLRAIENPDSVTAESWRKLLAKNDDIGRCTFTYDDKSHKLYMSLKIRNINMTASKLRKELDLLAEKIQSTQNIWYKDALKTENKTTFPIGPKGPSYSTNPSTTEKRISIEGNWNMFGGVEAGVEKSYSLEQKMLIQLTITKDEIVAKQDGKIVLKRKYKLEDSSRPTTIDWIDDKGGIEYGLIRFNSDDEFSVCFPNKIQLPRPADFVSTQQNKQVIMKLRRAK